MPWLSQLARSGHRRAHRPRPAARRGCSGPDRAAPRRGPQPRRLLVQLAGRDVRQPLAVRATRPARGPSSCSTTSGCSTAAITSRLALEQARRALAEAIDASARCPAGLPAALRRAWGTSCVRRCPPSWATPRCCSTTPSTAPRTTWWPAMLRDGPRIVRASEQLLAIVDSLLGAGRALAGDDARRDVAVADALADVVHWHRTPAATAAVEMTVDVDPGLTVWAHAAGVRQVLTNLLGNAIAHHDPAADRSTSRPSRLVGESGLPMVRIVVRDDGPGLEPDQLARAFEPFVRFAATGRQGHRARALDLADHRRARRGCGAGRVQPRRRIDVLGGAAGGGVPGRARGRLSRFRLHQRPHVSSSPLGQVAQLVRAIA